jgi:hypothetical protein
MTQIYTESSNKQGAGMGECENEGVINKNDATCRLDSPRSFSVQLYFPLHHRADRHKPSPQAFQIQPRMSEAAFFCSRTAHEGRREVRFFVVFLPGNYNQEWLSYRIDERKCICNLTRGAQFFQAARFQLPHFLLSTFYFLLSTFPCTLTIYTSPPLPLRSASVRDWAWEDNPDSSSPGLK